MTPPYAILDPASPFPRVRSLCALAMMIKAPRAGASKTRLVPPLTQEEAAALSVCFLRDTAANIASACEASASAAEGVAVYTPVGAESAFDGLLPVGFSLLAQRGDGFGERLFNAADDLLRVGYDSLCLIDSDSPTLPRAALVAAVAELAKPGDRVVLGAADDGGYYLIGIKRAHRRLFERIEWSTARVAAQTIERADEIDLPVALLPAWYDVDDAPTLARLCQELCGTTRETTEPRRVEARDAGCAVEPESYAAPHTRDFLARLIAREGRGRVWREPPPGDCDVEADTQDARRAEATS
jgi:rSAM/selenodomain-associated transferase 1